MRFVEAHNMGGGAQSSSAVGVPGQEQRETEVMLMYEVVRCSLGSVGEVYLAACLWCIKGCSLCLPGPEV